jgi:SHS2 domain-containing protein
MASVKRIMVRRLNGLKLKISLPRKSILQTRSSIRRTIIKAVTFHVFIFLIREDHQNSSFIFMEMLRTLGFHMKCWIT